MPGIRDLAEWEDFRQQMIDARVAPPAVFPDLVKPPAEPARAAAQAWH